MATAFRWRKSKPDWPVTLWAASAALAGAFLGSRLRGALDMELLKKLLGALFLASGFREIALWHKEGRTQKRAPT